MVIDTFSGRYRFLSNFAPSPIVAVGIRFPTVEHAFQALKSTSRSDWEKIAMLPTPGLAKRAGRGLALRSNWSEVRVAVMTTLVLLKFCTHVDLQRRLVATAPATLIEGNTWGDRFWGVCGGVGENNLGKILMYARDLAAAGCLPHTAMPQ
ncbi:NADAR family protein [Azospirillum sp. Sh1]|uniref:NADAR family protein n=1 Tax=Azospirillum sp. Sh1 TaxID=2607285 RepID=UPI00165E74E9|nr:NADAR family protein [Azospirillum sp. Sh1]